MFHKKDSTFNYLAKLYCLSCNGDGANHFISSQIIWLPFNRLSRVKLIDSSHSGAVAVPTTCCCMNQADIESATVLLYLFCSLFLCWSPSLLLSLFTSHPSAVWLWLIGICFYFQLYNVWEAVEYRYWIWKHFREGNRWTVNCSRWMRQWCSVALPGFMPVWTQKSLACPASVHPPGIPSLVLGAVQGCTWLCASWRLPVVQAKSQHADGLHLQLAADRIKLHDQLIINTPSLPHAL